MDAGKVCRQLLAAETERAVQDIIDVTPELRDQANWTALDGRETNFNVTSNQASNGGKALTELMTNMVDAVLTKQALSQGIDPLGPEAPKTMYEAVATLFDKKFYGGGRLVDLGHDSWLREFSKENLVIGITGAKAKSEGLPSYTFADNGEGQKACDFETTFLSLSAGNKKNIPFVQGKFNMGSSGVLRYCGYKWFKLIVSRRYDRKSPWAWTLVRRRPDDGENMPIAEYFTLPGGVIPEFKADKLYPFRTMLEKQYDGFSLDSGTIVKLFDYQIGSAYRSFRGAREALNENLVETILPFQLLDFRQLPKGERERKKAERRGGYRAMGIDSRPFYGMEFLLLHSHKEENFHAEEDAAGERIISVGKISDDTIGRIAIRAIRLRRDLPAWLKPPKNINRVFHAVNGQVQFKQTRGFISQCGFPALKDRVVIIVDSSNLKFGAHNDIWKGDRENIHDTITGERYKELVAQTIKESEALKQMQIQISQEELKRATRTESNEIFQRLVDADRNLAGLLSNLDPSIRLPALGGENGDKSGDEFEGQFSPTFLRFERQSIQKGIDFSIDRSRPIVAKTDVVNGYFDRADNTGSVILDDSVKEKFSFREHLNNGRLVLYMEPNLGKVEIGDELPFKVGLYDDSMTGPVETETVTIRIVENEKIQKRDPRPVPPKPPVERGEEPTVGLPQCILLTKDGREIPNYNCEIWPPDLDFSERDGGLIADYGEEKVYKINYDNSYHLRYRSQQRGDVAKDALTAKYILGMRILMLGYEHSLSEWKKASGNENASEFEDEFRRMAARGAASTVIALAESLPKFVDQSKAQQEVDE